MSIKTVCTAFLLLCDAVGTGALTHGLLRAVVDINLGQLDSNSKLLGIDKGKPHHVAKPIIYCCSICCIIVADIMYQTSSCGRQSE